MTYSYEPIIHIINILMYYALWGYSDTATIVLIKNWRKGKPTGSIACTRKQQPRSHWSRPSVVMNDATPLTPPSAWAELHFQM